MKRSKNAWIALAVVATWLAITIGGGHLQGGGHAEVDDLVKHGMLWALVAEITFLLVMTKICGGRISASSRLTGLRRFV